MEFPLNTHGKRIDIAKQIPIAGGTWFVPEEVPIAFVFNRRNYAVMMGTPQDLVDFALGFSLTEEVIKTPSEIKSLEIYHSAQGVDLRFKLADEALERFDVTQRRRNMVGSASCGLCGLENVDTLFKTLPKVSDARLELSPEAMTKAMLGLRRQQTLNQKTHSVHAAAWASLGGDIKIIREDVGRHNALDKLLGAMAISETKVAEGFVLMSSRCSYEIVEKAARRGVQAVLSISGPTAFALRKAQEANMAIYSRSGEGAVRLL